jgi:hypothetical protein
MAARPRVDLSDTYLSIDQPRQWLHRITSALLTQAEQIKQSADFATPLQANFGLPLRQLYKKIHETTTRKKLQAPPVECLIDSWKQVQPQSAQLAGDLLAAFRYRHWLAHGRYWVFRGNAISHDLLFHLVSRLFKSLEASEAGFHPDPVHKS